MNAVSTTILVALLLGVFFAPRRWALLAIVCGVFFLTQGHSVEVGGLNLYPIRILEAAAFGRVVLRRELVWSHLGRIDWALLLLYNYTALVWIIRSPDTAAHQVASALDPTLCYLALRGLTGGLDDFRWLLKMAALLLVPYTALVLAERWTGQSMFLIVGATNELAFRDGVVRGMGSFRHAILLGSMAASLLPLYIGLYLGRTHRVLAALGGGGLCLGLVFLSNSGGPVASTAAAFIGWLLWPLRARMFIVRRALVVLLLLVLLFMKAPIWYLPFKISGVVGGTGYHRGLLMERAWQDLDKWWLVGMDLRDTSHWIPYIDDFLGGADITNQFLVWGIRAGLVAIAMSVIVLSLAFKAVGSAMASAARTGESFAARGFLLWGLGVAIFVHIVSWLGISYFDQSWVIWLIHLVTLSAAVQTLNSHPRERTISLIPAHANLFGNVAHASTRKIGVRLPGRGPRFATRGPAGVSPARSVRNDRDTRTTIPLTKWRQS